MRLITSLGFLSLCLGLGCAHAQTYWATHQAGPERWGFVDAQSSVPAITPLWTKAQAHDVATFQQRLDMFALTPNRAVYTGIDQRERYLVSLSLDTGAEIYRHNLGPWFSGVGVSAPAVTSNGSAYVIVGSNVDFGVESHLRSYAANGSLNWRVSLEDSLFLRSFAPIARGSVISATVRSDCQVDLVFASPLGCNVEVGGNAPAFYGNTRVMGGEGRTLFLTSDTGTQSIFLPQSIASQQTPLVVGDRAYVLSTARLYVIDLIQGALQSEHVLPDTLAAPISSDGGSLYLSFPFDGRLQVRNLDGTLRQSVNTLGVAGAAIVTRNHLFVRSIHETLVLDKSTLAPVARLPYRGLMALASDRLVVYDYFKQELAAFAVPLIEFKDGFE
jgi:hypothetical protein